MVSFWPFKSDDTSAASFEKTLSQLSQKITKASSKNDTFRQKQRRYKVLWTLYTSFAYILIVLLLTLVSGWETWGATEYSTVAGAPLLIYGVRSALDAYFNYRIANAQNSLDELYKQREVTIEKLKTATKYNSTQQLLDKYAGTPKKRQPSPAAANKRKSGGGPSEQSTPQGGRTGFVPPATANIAGRSPPPNPATPQGAPQALPTPPQPHSPTPQTTSPTLNEEFAPNAYPPARATFPLPASANQYATSGSRWYDRILDVILGEDETQASNRIVLICQNCRLVNGQAPPGTRALEEVGRWRCANCRAWNGVESEEKKILKEIELEDSVALAEGGGSAVVKADVDGTGLEAERIGEEEMMEDVAGSDDDLVEIEPTVAGADEIAPASSTRSKLRQRKKA